MNFEGNTETFVNIGLHDNVLPHWYEAQFHRDKAHKESRNLSELIRHPSKEETARHWIIATRDFNAMAIAVSKVLEAEIEDSFNNNPMMTLMAMLEAMSEMSED